MREGIIIPLTRQQLEEIYYSGARQTLRLIDNLYEVIVDFEQNYESHLQRYVDAVDEANTRLEKKITKLKERNYEICAENGRLKERIKELEKASVASGASVERDSHNSHRPPSTDPVYRKPVRSLRRPSGRGVGGQPGHRGSTRPLTEQPDEVVRHVASECGECGASLSESPVVGCDVRQVIDLPPVVPVVVEHRGLKKKCGTGGAVTKAMFPKLIKAGVQYGAGVLCLWSIPDARTSCCLTGGRAR